MRTTHSTPSNKPLKLLPWLAALAGLSAFMALPASAEKTDRDKPMYWSADNSGDFVVGTDGELIGNVLLTQGTMRLEADRIKAQLPADGFYRFSASSTSERQVNFRQARDTAGETVEGLADRVEYDTKTDSVRFVGHAVLRLLRGSLVAQEASGATLVYDKRTETIRATAGDAAPHPGGRIRGMILPPQVGASAPAAAASSVPLQPSTTIQQPGARKGT
ncbi:LptA/OstA family protein [Burkholderiaceae bacterium UC74_6]